MADPIRDDDPPDIARFAPKRLRELVPDDERPFITSAPMAPSFRDANQEQRTRAERDSWPERMPEPPVPLEDGTTSSLLVRVSLVVIFAAVVALGVILARPIVQGVRAWFDIAQPSGSSDRPTANPSASNAPSNEPVAPKTQVAAAPAVAPATVAQPAANTQQAALAPAAQPASVRTPVRG
ncbi:MAG TPA: hypothetical protein VI358_04445, partial [Pseudolabrys sp.]